jgi:hydroxymethylpyrimidine pyrophosphatase-like HAD family hydrolase
MLPIKLVLADVDGTLVTHEKILTPRAISGVRALADAGIAFAITSGRPPRGMQMFVEPLGLTTPLAAFNGGRFVHPDLSLVEQHVLTRNVVEPILELIEARQLDAWIYRGNDWFVRERHGPHVDRDQSSKVFAARSQPYYVDITHPRANKGEVVRVLAKMLKIEPSEVATLGDMPNDIAMFERSGLSIAMGQSSDEVKRAATQVTASSEDEGFASAIERLILG